MKLFLRVFWTSGQDGDIVGKWSLPACTTRRRTTPNLKTKNNPELPENRTLWKSNNQGVKKKHSFRLAGGTEVGSRVERTHNKVAAGGLGGPIFACR